MNYNKEIAILYNVFKLLFKMWLKSFYTLFFISLITYSNMLEIADSLTQNMSTALYRLMCQNIVGSEEHVKRMRLMNTVRDNWVSNSRHTTITSGSFGEGLDLKGSDIDFMHVQKGCEVDEDVKPRLDASLTYVAMKTDNVKPGFTQLILKQTCL